MICSNSKKIWNPQLSNVLSIVIRQFNPWRCYEIFQFLITVFLLFRRKTHWLLWQPLPPQSLVKVILRLGTSFLKLAQVLATRADFFNDDYLNALRQLHDQMPAMTNKDRRKVFFNAFGDQTIFAEFDAVPLASASIGQVHRARLKHGNHIVAVKLLRHNIQWLIRCDIVLLNLFMVLFRPLFSDQTRHSIESLLKAFTEVILQEVSMNQELANLQHFSQTYSHSTVRFPTPYPEYCCDQALVMSFEQGVRIDDSVEIKKLGVDFRNLMHQLVLFYTEQMLVKGFFHADPHPGNLLVSPEGQLILVDFGMVSRIPKGMRQSMIYAVKASYERDFDQLVSATRKMGILTEESDLQDMSQVAERLFDIFDSDHLDASNMQDLAFGILEVLNDQPFKLPQDIIYVMRVSSMLEGLGTQYIANFNGIKDVLPILKENLSRALGEDRPLWTSLQHEAALFPLTLVKTRRVIELAEQGELVVRISREDRTYLERILSRHLKTLGGLIFLLAVAFYLRDSPYDWAESASWAALTASAIVALYSYRK